MAGPIGVGVDPGVHASMSHVTMQKSELRTALSTNLESHRAEFERALEGYRTRCIDLLEEHIQKIKAGKVERVEVYLPVPEDHTDDYTRGHRDAGRVHLRDGDSHAPGIRRLRPGQLDVEKRVRDHERAVRGLTLKPPRRGVCVGLLGLS
jgi:hypothetical protein